MLFRFTWGWEKHVDTNPHPALSTVTQAPPTEECGPVTNLVAPKPLDMHRDCSLEEVVQCACRLKP